MWGGYARNVMIGLATSCYSYSSGALNESSLIANTDITFLLLELDVPTCWSLRWKSKHCYYAVPGHTHF